MRIRAAIILILALCTSHAQASLMTGIEAYVRKDYTTALPHFLAEAKRGDTIALSYLSAMYLNGDGVPRDVQQAIVYATKCYEAKDPQGYSLLGKIYLSRRAGVYDKEKGIQYLRMGVEKNEFNSMISLAHELVLGKNVPRDFAQAYKYFEQAWTHLDGADGAALYLAMMNELGLGRPRDDVQARYWYEKMSGPAGQSLGPYAITAKVRLAQLKLRNPTRVRDEAHAVELYRDAAKAGNGEALYQLGRLHEAGRILKQDYAAAAVLYQAGADAGSSAAMYRGGLLFLKGLGVKQSTEEAMVWFREAADAGNSRAARRLGRAFDLGTTVKVDPAQARTWYCHAVVREAVAHVDIHHRTEVVLDTSDSRVSEQLAILDQCAAAPATQTHVPEARAALGSFRNPAIDAEAARLSGLMRASSISAVIADMD